MTPYTLRLLFGAFSIQCIAGSYLVRCSCLSQSHQLSCQFVLGPAHTLFNDLNLFEVFLAKYQMHFTVFICLHYRKSSISPTQWLHLYINNSRNFFLSLYSWNILYPGWGLNIASLRLHCLSVFHLYRYLDMETVIDSKAFVQMPKHWAW